MNSASPKKKAPAQHTHSAPGSLKKTLINLIFFQCVWFAAVVGGKIGNHALGPAALTVFIVCHYFLADTAKADFLLAGIAAATGLVLETVFLQSGLIKYVHNFPTTEFAPLWMLVLWANFALTMNGCLSWLQGRPLLAAILGFLGGPLSYYAGIRLGAAETVASTLIVLLIVGFTYALITPLFLETAQRLRTRLDPA
jgi:hypothetical protein